MSRWRSDVEEMSEVAPLAVDLVPWLTTDHREVITRVVRQCGSVTVLGYRDRSSRILADRMALPLFDGFAVHHLGSWRTMSP